MRWREQAWLTHSKYRKPISILNDLDADDGSRACEAVLRLVLAELTVES
jgi:hypothetical protein